MYKVLKVCFAGRLQENSLPTPDEWRCFRLGNETKRSVTLTSFTFMDLVIYYLASKLKEKNIKFHLSAIFSSYFVPLLFA